MEGKIEETRHSAVNVKVFDEAFYIPQLDRTRRIWVYKPEGHDKSEKRYPVIYMQDGQNLFDDSTAFGDEWGVDETLNSMQAQCIVVGIDNSEQRMTEYNFNDSKEYGPGEGEKYVRFIVETLKPLIDKTYKTNPSRKHTHIAGSSMGGLISLYAAMHFPEVFGGAGIFSPSLWIVPGYEQVLGSLAKKNTLLQKLYFYGGAQEGGDLLTHISAVTKLLNQYETYLVDVHIDPRGDHSEIHWRDMFPSYYLWLTQATS